MASAAGDGLFLLTRTVALGGPHAVLRSDRATNIVVDGDGNVRVAGIVGSYDFAGIDSARVTNAGIDQRFVARVDARSGEVAFVAVVGAANADPADTRLDTLARDGATGLAIDGAGNTYLVAYDASVAYPVTGGAYQPSTGRKHVYRVDGAGAVTRLPAELDPAIRRVAAIALDRDGAILVTGSAIAGLVTSAEAPFPTASVAEGCMAPFVLKLDPAGAAVRYATYLGVAGISGQRCGGEGEDGIHDPTGFALHVDAAGNAYVAGQAEPGLAATPGAVDVAPTQPVVHISPAFQSASHAFVAKLDAAGALLWAARLGGSDHDRGTSVAVDPAGFVYVGGTTASSALTTVGGFGAGYPWVSRPCLNATPEVGFVAKLSPDGRAIVLSGYVPSHGSQLDRCVNGGAFAPLHVMPDVLGDIVVAGVTSIVDRYVAASPAAIEPVPDGRGLLLVIAADGSGVRYATTFAGSGAYGAARDRWGNIATVDRTGIVRIVGPHAAPVALEIAPTPACAGRAIELAARVAASYDDGAVTFAIDGAPVATVRILDGVARTSIAAATGVRRVTATYAGGGIFDGYASATGYLAVNQAGSCP
ncbi:MAG: SBBP repeat-containing protein [Burkholderiales bacterium]